MMDARDLPKELCRGVCRALAQRGFATLAEVPLANGRRADVLALGRDGELAIVEIKSSVMDFKSDRKWGEYRAFCDRLYFAVASDFPAELIPRECGLIRADPFGAAFLREAPALPLAAARRRAMLLRFAAIAAGRLRRLTDPGIDDPELA
ncbi:MAG TPA: MmcB family DNA repair protein [Stellaceae bacterium]|nr:MmcB family DNA repair protein [Stellaceae bacterium]